MLITEVIPDVIVVSESHNSCNMWLIVLLPFNNLINSNNHSYHGSWLDLIISKWKRVEVINMCQTEKQKYKVNTVKYAYYESRVSQNVLHVRSRCSTSAENAFMDLN